MVLPSLGGSVWSTFGRNESYWLVLAGLSGLLFTILNRLSSLDGSLWPTLGRNKQTWP